MSEDAPYGYCHCGCGQKTALAPQTNKGKGYVKGEPIRFVKGHHMRIRYPSAKERFWANVEKTDTCWLWVGYKCKAGYGEIEVNGTTWRASRYSWFLHNGPIPEGMLICHRCDNPRCINPAHLFIGKDADNTHDMISKGRNKYIGKKGQSHHSAKLTDNQVKEIRSRFAEGEKQVTLAQRYNVAHGLISAIVHNKIWTHIT